MSANKTIRFYEKTKRYVLTLDRESVSALNNALNEVCNGVDIKDWEFATRLGCTRAEMLSLLKLINDSLR